MPSYPDAHFRKVARRVTSTTGRNIAHEVATTPTIVSIQAHQPDDRPFCGPTGEGGRPQLIKSELFQHAERVRMSEPVHTGWTRGDATYYGSPTWDDIPTR